MGSLGPFKGRWLKTLVDTYVNGVRPPDNTIGIIEQGVIRYCMVGKGLTAEETRTVIKNLRQRLPDKSFSDRLLYDEAELDRANEYLLKDPLAYLPDPERSRAIWQKVDAYCAKIGFDIRNPDTWKLPGQRPGSNWPRAQPSWRWQRWSPCTCAARWKRPSACWSELPTTSCTRTNWPTA